MMIRTRGFTLIELVVSLALFAVIYVVTYETLSSVINGSSLLTDEQKRWRELDMAFVQMQEDLRFASPRGARGIDGNPLPPVTGDLTDVRAVSNPTLELTRSGVAALATEHETGLRRVAYRLKEKKLYREIWPVVDRKYDSEPTSVLLATDVAGFEVRYLDTRGQWQSRWPVPDRPLDELPVAVDVTLTFDDDTTINRWFSVNG